jgi:hypothetical protein
MEILDFTSFVNEMFLSDHWKERTSERGESGKKTDGSEWTWKSSSRILPVEKSEHGWELAALLDDSGREISKYDFFVPVTYEKESILSLISDCLRQMTRSSAFERYVPKTKKRYLLMKLGSVSLWNGIKEAKVSFRAKDYEGDGVYGIAGWDPILDEYKAITILFHGSKNTDRDSFIRNVSDHLNKIKKVKYEDYFGEVDFVYPYGENFKCVIDLTQSNITRLENQIKSQVEGFNPGVKKEKKDPSEIEEVYEGQFGFSPGRKISIKVPYIDAENFTEVEIKGIVNLSEIQNYSKSLNYDKATEVKISFSPIDKSLKKEKDGKEIYGVYTLRERSEFLNHHKKRLRIEKRNKSIIVQNPTIIKKGSIPVWVKEI